MERIESAIRTREIEEPTNLYFVHPLAARLTPVLACLRVRPNAVSVAGMISGILAGCAYHFYQDPRFAIAGFLFMIGWHILDGADGQLARYTGTQSEFGKIVDGIADNVTFAAVYLGLGLALMQTHGTWVWAVIIVASISHSLQAASYEAQRQEYDFWGWNKQPAELKSAAILREEFRPQSLAQRIVYALGRSYAQMQHLAARIDPQQRHKIALALKENPERTPAIRQRYRQTFAGLVRFWSIMSSNYRSLLIFACAIFEVPLAYFVIEAVGFSVLTIVMIRQHKVRTMGFLRFLDRQTQLS